MPSADGESFSFEQDNDNSHLQDSPDDDENDDGNSAEEKYGDWFWDGESGEWYWVYFDDSDYAADDVENEGYNTHDDDDDDDDDNDDNDDDDDNDVADVDDGNNDEEDEGGQTYESDPESESGSDSDSDDSNSPASQALIVYDWDDTLLPTSYLRSYFEVSSLGSSIYEVTMDSYIESKLERIEELVISLLQKSALLGTVKIVTNASENWVEKSSGRLMPSLHNYLMNKGIEIISARSQYQPHFPDNHWEYKTRVFDDEVRHFLNNSDVLPQNFTFVSIGDSQFERYAAQNLSSIIPKDRIKIVGLEDRPHISTLKSQIKELYRILEYTVVEDGHMDFSVDTS